MLLNYGNGMLLRVFPFNVCVCICQGPPGPAGEDGPQGKDGPKVNKHQTFFFHSFPFLDIFILSNCTLIGLVVLLLLLQGEQGDHGAMGEPGERSEVGDPGPPGPPGDAGIKGFPVSA